MADIAVVTGSVRAINPPFGISQKIITILSGQAITAGQVVFRNQFGQAGLCYSLDSLMSIPLGIAMNSTPSQGQPLNVAVSGDVFLGSGVVTIGTAYIVSDNFGGIANQTDFGLGWYPGLVGLGVSSSVLRISLSKNQGLI